MKETEPLSAEQSLDLITSMILEAKANLQRNNFFYLFWGWIIVIGNVGMYALTKTGYGHPYAVWAITIPAWIFTLIKVFGGQRHSRVKTHLGSINGWLWLCFGISTFIIVAFGYKINFQINPMILTIAAIPTVISGLILKFRPLILGGIGFWIFAIIGFLVSQEIQPLIGAAAIICGYLVPGYMLKSNRDGNVQRS